MNRERIIRVPVLRADQRPAHEHFVARVTASMIREHGSYEAARAALQLRTVRTISPLRPGDPTPSSGGAKNERNDA